MFFQPRYACADFGKVEEEPTNDAELVEPSAKRGLVERHFSGIVETGN